MCLMGRRWGFWDSLTGRWQPRRLWPRWHQRHCDEADQSGLWAGSGKGEPDTGCHLDNPHAELQEPQADGGELGRGEHVGFWDGVSDGEHQPVGGGVQDEPHLIGERAAAAGAVGGELGLVQLDEILRLAAGAVERLVDILGRPGLDVSDNEADVEALGGSLDSGAGAPVGLPGFRLIVGLGEAAQAGLLVERPAGANVVGGLVDSTVEHGITGETEDEVDAILLAPLHDLRPAVMPVPTDGDARGRPVLPYAADEPAQMATYLDARGGLAGAQQHGNRPAGRRVVDMDRQEAALIVMGVEQRKLLVAMDDIHRIVDVERHRIGWPRVARTVEIDHHPHQADEIAQGWQFDLPVLPPSPLGPTYQHELTAPALSRIVNGIYAQYDALNFRSLAWAYWHALCSTTHISGVHYGALIEG